MKEVLVLGGTGMLGSMVADVLSRDPELHVRATARDAGLARRFAERASRVEWSLYDAAMDDERQLEITVNGAAWVVNCIGLTKPYAHDGNAAEVRRAIRINSEFPFELAAVVARREAKVIQIATDCVYSGRQGGYSESAVHDALDVYGKTKSLGEVPSPLFRLLRASIIGPEPKAFVFLLEWFRRQAAGAQVRGFVHHLWNGVTTLHFARLALGIIHHDSAPAALCHVLPAAPVSKAELLGTFAKSFGRGDIAIEPVAAGTAVDRTLATDDPARNRALWEAAGYDEPPTIPQMLDELAAFDYHFANC